MEFVALRMGSAKSPTQSLIFHGLLSQPCLLQFLFVSLYLPVSNPEGLICLGLFLMNPRRVVDFAVWVEVNIYFLGRI